MSRYLVECVGEVREVYSVEAVSAVDAMERWHEGNCLVSEPSSVEAVSAALEEL